MFVNNELLKMVRCAFVNLYINLINYINYFIYYYRKGYALKGRGGVSYFSFCSDL